MHRPAFSADNDAGLAGVHAGTYVFFVVRLCLFVCGLQTCTLGDSLCALLSTLDACKTGPAHARL